MLIVTGRRFIDRTTDSSINLTASPIAVGSLVIFFLPLDTSIATRDHHVVEYGKITRKHSCSNSCETLHRAWKIHFVERENFIVERQVEELNRWSGTEIEFATATSLPRFQSDQTLVWVPTNFHQTIDRHRYFRILLCIIVITGYSEQKSRRGFRESFHFRRNTPVYRETVKTLPRVS